MGLENNFAQIRLGILGEDPWPNVIQAYSKIIHKE